jgi:hypothetical protein
MQQREADLLTAVHPLPAWSVHAHAGNAPDAVGPYHVPFAGHLVGSSIMMLDGFGGFVSRLHGLSLHNLVEVDMVLASGQVMIVSEDEHPGRFLLPLSFPPSVAHPFDLQSSGSPSAAQGQPSGSRRGTGPRVPDPLCLRGGPHSPRPSCSSTTATASKAHRASSTRMRSSPPVPPTRTRSSSSKSTTPGSRSRAGTASRTS